MAQTNYTVKSYSYYFDAKTGGARLLQLWSDTALIADVRFIPDGTARPATSFSANLASARLYFWVSAAQGLIDMLRNEKPVYLLLNDDPTNGWALISTGLEPIGEGE